MTASPTDDLASAERRIQELTKELSKARGELAEARKQQTATADVLKVISTYPSDVGPVYESILASVMQLCEANIASVFLYDGEMLRSVAHKGATPEFAAQLDSLQFPPSRRTPTRRAALERKVIHMPDVRTDPEYQPTRAHLTESPTSVLSVPMLRDDVLLGVLTTWRRELRPFSDEQIALVKTFADQAVIAIENTRLFEAEQASKRELQESLQFQTATGDVLNVISRSPSQLQPVFDSIAQSASRQCGGEHAIVTRYDGRLLHLAAQHNPRPGSSAAQAAFYPRVPARNTSISGRALVDMAVVHVSDIEKDELDPAALEGYRRMGLRAAVAVPMLHNGQPIGVIGVSRGTPGAFSEQQIQLLKTFADQAVIAIENTRLFEAEQASRRALQESLEYQTATSEVLKVISRSPSEVGPVLDAIVQTASTLCKADNAYVFQLYRGKYHVMAHNQRDPDYLKHLMQNPIDPDQPGSVTARAARERLAIHIPDTFADPEYRFQSGHARARQTLQGRGAGEQEPRTLLSVPLLREGVPIGVITMDRAPVRPFSIKEVEVVTTFADQAVIAIENTRLFEAEQASKRELQESLEYQTATSDVLSVIGRSKFDLQPVLDTLVASAARLCDAQMVAIHIRHDNTFPGRARYGVPPEMVEALSRIGQVMGRGSLVGRTIAEGRPVHIPDAAADPEYTNRDFTRITGARSLLGVPLMRDGKPVGLLSLYRARVSPFSERQIELMATFADQAVIAIENTRLFEEVQARTRELAKTIEDLEIASQHKNQFVANMSHELRTPLAAILGYAELIQEGFYGAQPEKAMDALTRIRSNGKHLLGLINTVLDIAKIESGQFTLNMSEYAIESVVETVRAATESLAHNKKLTLTTSVDKSLPVGLGDEQRLTQVLLNLVGNAIKFTDAGAVSIAAGARNGRFAVCVTDTGPGIPLDQQDRIFDQFHQVDSSLTTAKGGTGLGLAIAKEIVQMHGGRIWVESTLGRGSNFQLELPIRAEIRRGDAFS